MEKSQLLTTFYLGFFYFCPNEDFHTLTSRGWSNSETDLINTDSPFHLISHGKFMMICYEVVISKGIKTPQDFIKL